MMQNILKLLGVEDAEAAQPIAPSLQQFLQQDYRKSQNLTAPENLRKPDPVSKRIKAAISKGSNLDAEAKKVAAEAVRNLPKNPSDITDQSIAEEKAMYDKSIQENIMRGEAAVDQADDEYLRKNDKPKYIMKMLSKYSAPGVSQKLSMAMPDVVSPFQNDIMMMNAEDVMKRFEVGKFDNETLAPDAANYRDRLLKQIARADSGDKTDLAPILRGIGNLTGTKLAEGYETNDARSNRLSELLGASNIKTSGVYDKNDRTLIDLYKGQKLPPSMVSASSSTDLPRAVSSGSGGSQAARLNASLEDKIRKEVFDKVIAKYSDKQQGFDQLDEAFSRNDLQSIRANLSVFAKTVGKEAGVLTDQDVTRVLPANIATTLAGIEAYFADTPTAKLDPAFSKGLRELTALAKKKTREKYSNDLEALRASFGSEGSSYKKFMGENMPGSAIFSQADKMFKSSDRVKSEGLLSSEASQNWLKQKRSGKK